MSHYTAIMERLRRNPLKNVTLLKMMTAYHAQIDSVLIEQQEEWGVLLLMPAATFGYDHRTYPEADTVVLMDYSSPEVFPALLKRLPRDANLVFKLQEDAYRQALEPYFTLRRVRSLYCILRPKARGSAQMRPARSVKLSMNGCCRCGWRMIIR